MGKISNSLLALGLATQACEKTPEQAVQDTVPALTEQADTGFASNEEVPLTHCEYVAANVDYFAVQLHGVVDSMPLPEPMGFGSSEVIVKGPQGGYHVEVDAKTSCWYDPELLADYLQAQGMRVVNPATDGVNLRLSFTMADAAGVEMYHADLNRSLPEQGDLPFPMEFGQNLLIFSAGYLQVSGGAPLDTYPDVTITVSAYDPICEIPFPDQVFAVNLSYVPAE